MFDGFRSSKQCMAGSDLPAQIEAGPGGAGKVQADQLVLSEQVRAFNTARLALLIISFTLLQVCMIDKFTRCILYALFYLLGEAK